MHSSILRPLLLSLFLVPALSACDSPADADALELRDATLTIVPQPVVAGMIVQELDDAFGPDAVDALSTLDQAEAFVQFIEIHAQQCQDCPILGFSAYALTMPGESVAPVPGKRYGASLLAAAGHGEPGPDVEADTPLRGLTWLGQIVEMGGGGQPAIGDQDHADDTDVPDTDVPEPDAPGPETPDPDPDPEPDPDDGVPICLPPDQCPTP